MRRLPQCIGWFLHPFFSLRETALLEAFVPESRSRTPSKSMLLMNYTARHRTSQASFWNWVNQANCKQSYVRHLALLRARPKSLGLSPILYGARLSLCLASYGSAKALHQHNWNKDVVTTTTATTRTPWRAVSVTCF